MYLFSVQFFILLNEDINLISINRIIANSSSELLFSKPMIRFAEAGEIIADSHGLPFQDQVSLSQKSSGLLDRIEPIVGPY